MSAADPRSFRGIPAVLLALALAASAAWLDESGLGRRWQAAVERTGHALVVRGARWAVDETTDAAVAFARAAAAVVPGLRQREPERSPERCDASDERRWPRG